MTEFAFVGMPRKRSCICAITTYAVVLDSHRYGRSGAIIELPRPFIQALEVIKLFLDGEMWFGRGTFQEAQDLINGVVELPDNVWSFLRYPPNNQIIANIIRMVAFDDPSPHYCSFKFEKRYRNLVTTITNDHPFLVSSRCSC